MIDKFKSWVKAINSMETWGEVLSMYPGDLEGTLEPSL